MSQKTNQQKQFKMKHEKKKKRTEKKISRASMTCRMISSGLPMCSKNLRSVCVGWKEQKNIWIKNSQIFHSWWNYKLTGLGSIKSPRYCKHKESTPRHITIKLLKSREKRKILKAAKDQDTQFVFSDIKGVWIKE